MLARPTQLLLPDPRQQLPMFPPRALAEIVEALADLMLQVVEAIDNDGDRGEPVERGAR